MQLFENLAASVCADTKSGMGVQGTDESVTLVGSNAASLPSDV